MTFVVIALSTEAKRVNPSGLRAYVTPTIVHFGAVLLLSVYLNMPHHSVLSLSVGLRAVGAAGVLYAASVGRSIAHLTSDWHRPSLSIYGVAVVSVLLMFVGIHNSWDVAVWNTLRKQKKIRRSEALGLVRDHAAKRQLSEFDDILHLPALV